MRKHIANLQEQHPAVRTRAAFTYAAGLTALIALVWVTTLPIRLSQSISSNNAGANTASAVSAFGQTVGSNVSGMQRAFSNTDGAVPTSVKGVDVVPNPTDGSQALENGAPATYIPTNTTVSSSAATGNAANSYQTGN